MGSLTDEMNAKGSAQVMVFLKLPVAAAMSMKESAPKRSGEFITTGGITSHFIAPAKATAMAQSKGVTLPLAGMRYYPNLGIALGTVNNSFQKLTQLLRFRGILPVFAIGNEGPGSNRSPGNYPETLSVGASDSHDQVADFSSSESFAQAKNPRNVPELVGPGVGVISAKFPGGGYQSMDGTSMATPQIAGLAALLIQACPTATVDQLEEAIFSSCRVLPGVPSVRQGRGLPNGLRALEALRRAIGGAGEIPAPEPSPTSRPHVAAKCATGKKKTAKLCASNKRS